MSEFLGLSFQPLSLDHQSALESWLSQCEQQLTGYSFASLISWNDLFSYEWALCSERFLLISAISGPDKRRHLLLPQGPFTDGCANDLVAQISKLDYPLRLHGVTRSFIDRYPSFCSHFEVVEDRDLANYIYKTDDLAELAGRRYSKKRNLLAQIDYEWSVHSLAETCRDNCVKILEEMDWEAGREMSESLLNERRALDVSMRNLSRLKLKGLTIRISGRSVAFSLYERLNSQTAVIHFEKAERNFKGLYQLVNRETAKMIQTEGYATINREEDLGIPGLRQAKESYHPIEIRPHHILTFKK